MSLNLESNNMQDYLACTDIIDFEHPDIKKEAIRLAGKSQSSIELIKNTYEFVRDAIHHSADIEGKTVTCKASEVLHAKEGLCYAKSHLLVALLRHNEIPTGFCYQLLSSKVKLEEALVLHGLVAVFLEGDKKWLRLDARGNKAGIDAQFSTTQEKLAYAVHPEKGEKDFFTVFAVPDANIIYALTTFKNLDNLWQNLPRSLSK